MGGGRPCSPEKHYDMSSPPPATIRNDDLETGDLKLEETGHGPQLPEPQADSKSEDAVTTATEPVEPYTIFTDRQRWLIAIVAAIGATCSPISSNIYVPAIPTLADAFHVSEEKINLTVTVYLIFQAITPAFWGAAADAYGRRPVFIATVLMFTLACIGTALCPTSDYWLLVLMRILQASGASATIAVGAGVIADMALPHERGKFLAVFNVTSTFGPSMGPLLGGVFAYTLGWRSIFWFLTIMGGVVLVPMVLAFPETLRSIVGNGSLPPPILNCTPQACIRRRRSEKEYAQGGLGSDAVAPLPYKKFAPFTSFVLLLEPDLLLMLIWSSLYYALYYAVLTIFSTLLDQIYHYSEIIIGVCYISNGAGVAVGGIATGRLMDKMYNREKVRVGGDHRTTDEFRLEWVRLSILPWHAGILIVSSIGLGWSMKYHVHVSVPLILNFIFGIGTGFLAVTTIFALDLFPGKGGAVTASFNLTRCLFGAVEVATVQLINKAMGAGWMFVLLSGICLLATPLPLLVVRYGPRWRKRRAELAARREAESIT